MKVLGVIGSPKEDGNTAQLLKRTLDLLEEGGVETETVFLRDLDIRPCDGCGYCKENGKCKIEDGMQDLYEKLEEYDVVILSSPSYLGGVTSRLKAFMERTWFLRRGQLRNKIGTSIVVGRREIGCCVNEMDEYFDRMEFFKVPGILGFGLDKGDVMEDAEALKGAERVASKILQLSSVGLRSTDPGNKGVETGG